MFTKPIDENENDTLDMKSTPSKALIIGEEEFVKINVSNKLNTLKDYQIITKDNLSQGIEEIHNNDISLLIIDIDNIMPNHLDRLYKVIINDQIPSMFIGSDLNFLNKMRAEYENKILCFLPKSIINSMFIETLDLLLNKTNKVERFNNRFMAASTLKRTKTYYLLGTILLTEPLLKLLFLKVNTGFDWEIVLRTTLSMNGISANFQFWFMFPLAAFALFSVRSWSLLVFSFIQAYALYHLVNHQEFTWPYISETPYISSSLLLTINAALVFFLMTPENRKPYWLKTRSIWRSTARFATSLKTSFSYGDITQETTITNISETGAYFTCKEKLDIGHKMKITVPMDGKTTVLDAIIRRTQDTAHENYFGYGVEFQFNNKHQKSDFHDYVKNLTIRVQ